MSQRLVGVEGQGSVWQCVTATHLGSSLLLAWWC